MPPVAPTRAHHRRARPGASWWYLGCLVTPLAEAAHTGGRLSAVEAVVPGGLSVPMHVHGREDEAFFVTDGAIRITVGGEAVEASEGTFVWMPRAVPHGFEVLSRQATALILCTPGGHLERMFAPFSEPASELVLPPPPADPPMADILALDLELGVEYPGPPAGS
ncbi:cupin domain-containing protein [Geodermatophilus sp. YIM 151500]|uniref:cupin domain-containing protein n=1 Tax=Geodermatophilus sp. YIM 151500 TaxID=2984531 RepID=UPI0021E43C95|nr:cupin domain-containing protein [Geodermatophilus sp. YIM 151500]MCV2491587.1 cupin domain-containing protein [Geodermatophilus sp. YIM 151500]